MFEITPIVSVSTKDDFVNIVATDTYNPSAHEDGKLHYWLWKIADASMPLVDAAVANFANYRFFIDSQGYLVITKKETAHA